MGEPKDLNKLISFTFDENPVVRIKAAELLAKHDDPAAVFALMELGYDKDPVVRKKAQDMLGGKKGTGAELLSFAELFSKNAPAAGESEKERANDAKKERILSPISKMFERHLGKEKAELVKKRMMPTIERIYYRGSPTAAKEKPETQDEHGRKVMQEFLTSYLEAMADIGEETPGKQEKPQPSRVLEEKEEVMIKPESGQEMELEEVGRGAASEKLESDLQRIEDDEIAELEGEKEIQKLPDTFFKKAYETMMLSGGNESLMLHEMGRMIKEVEHDVKIAFKLAKLKFKDKKITNITKINDGMKNINTDPLEVREVENIEYEKSKRKKEKAIATRIVVHDESGNEGVVYLDDGRGMLVRPGMKIKVVKGQAKHFASSGETVLTIGKRGEIYVIL
ncbi:MAG: HEAT repeat domain-containing protein [Candidatus Micrarchaeota archaeon]